MTAIPSNQLTLADLHTLITKAIASAGTANEIVPMAGLRQIKRAECLATPDDVVCLNIVLDDSPMVRSLISITGQHSDHIGLLDILGIPFDIHFKPREARLTLAEAQARADSLPADMITEDQWCQAVKTLLTEKGPGFAIVDAEAGTLMFLMPGYEPAVLCSISRTGLLCGDYSSLIEVEAHNLDTPDEDLGNPESAFRQVISSPSYVELSADQIEGLTKACTGG